MTELTSDILKTIGAQLATEFSLALVNPFEVACELAAGLGWDHTAFPITELWASPSILKKRWVTRSVNGLNAHLDPIRAGPHTYVSAAGNDTTGTGLVGAPYRTFDKAQDILNAAGVATGGAIHVIGSVDPYSFDRLKGFNPVTPTVPTIWIAEQGPVVTGTYDALTWVEDASNKGSYTTTRTTVGAIISRHFFDEDGNHRMFELAQDDATCARTPGTFFLGAAGALRATSIDGSPINDKSVLVLLDATHVKTVAATPVTFWLEAGDNYSNWDLRGGNNGVFQSAPTALPGSKILVGGKNVSARYASAVAGTGNVLTVNGVHGTVYFKDSYFARGQADLINPHNTNNGGAADMQVFLENCVGINTGCKTNTSNNPLTGHENVRMLVAGGDWSKGRGGNRIVHTGKYQLSALTLGQDFGDNPLQLSGVYGTLPSGISASYEDSIEVWHDLVEIFGATRVISTAKLHERRRPNGTRAAYAVAGATYDTW